ncbi:hypothetical protein SADUNF_Sadunf19G0111700 [Salix dunnii]|uniref:Uncharacterized protein n=1 Tax=Salix dunnii TaxID=1413687 RepID=A0A835MI77_9ROSI|nr:hypothetical protein SADUNF_Sadunf19G0111700 [Salix dunnii]
MEPDSLLPQSKSMDRFVKFPIEEGIKPMRKRIIPNTKNKKIGEEREVEIIEGTSQTKVCKAQIGDASKIVTSDSSPVNAWTGARPRRKERLALVVKTSFPFEKSLSFCSITK